MGADVDGGHPKRVHIEATEQSMWDRAVSPDEDSDLAALPGASSDAVMRATISGDDATKSILRKLPSVPTFRSFISMASKGSMVSEAEADKFQRSSIDMDLNVSTIDGRSPTRDRSTCRKSFMSKTDLIQMHSFASTWADPHDDAEETINRRRCFHIMRLKVWLFLEEPWDTLLSTVYSGAMVFAIVSSICYSIFGSGSDAWLVVIDPNLPMQLSTPDVLFNCLFLCDTTLRFWSFPLPCKFANYPKNFIDLVALLPFLLNYLLQVPEMAPLVSTLRWVANFQAFLRFLKLSRYFWGWQLLFHAVKDSSQALVLPFLFLLVITILGACSLVMCEALWAMSFLDATHEAKSAAGQLIVFLMMAFGMLFMAMPIAIVGACFSQTWFDQDRIVLLSLVRNRLNAQGYGPGDLRDVFDEVDEDGSGEIELSEFKNMIQTFNVRSLNAAKCRRLFAYFDHDSDGAISFHDFALTLYPDLIDLDGNFKDAVNEMAVFNHCLRPGEAISPLPECDEDDLVNSFPLGLDRSQLQVPYAAPDLTESDEDVAQLASVVPQPPTSQTAPPAPDRAFSGYDSFPSYTQEPSFSMEERESQIQACVRPSVLSSLCPSECGFPDWSSKRNNFSNFSLSNKSDMGFDNISNCGGAENSPRIDLALKRFERKLDRHTEQVISILIKKADKLQPPTFGPSPGCGIGFGFQIPTPHIPLPQLPHIPHMSHSSGTKVTGLNSNKSLPASRTASRRSSANNLRSRRASIHSMKHSTGETSISMEELTMKANFSEGGACFESRGELRKKLERQNSEKKLSHDRNSGGHAAGGNGAAGPKALSMFGPHSTSFWRG